MRYLILLAISFNVLADQAVSMKWDPVQGATGYNVYCAPIPKRTVTNTVFEFKEFPDSPKFNCGVTAFNSYTESEQAVSSVAFESRGGVVYTTDISPPGSICAATASYVVSPNPSPKRPDKARPLYKLQNPSLPLSDTNKLVPIYPSTYVPAGTACQAPAIYRSYFKTTGGYAVCLKQ